MAGRPGSAMPLPLCMTTPRLLASHLHLTELLKGRRDCTLWHAAQDMTQKNTLFLVVTVDA